MSELSLIGFGEAASAFASSAGWGDRVRVFDIKTEADATRPAKRAEYSRAGVVGCDDLGSAVAGAPIVLSLVTADQALAAATAAAPHLASDARWIDMNSVAPDTKRRAAAAIVAAGARYVDAAVMAPVHPLGRAVPLLVAGDDADIAALQAIGFSHVRSIAGGVGAAAAVKMVRSVLIKGIEAMIAECVLAGGRAGVLGEVVASLDPDLRGRIDPALKRMLVHGRRRAAEMTEAATTLQGLGIPPLLTRGTIAWQDALGRLDRSTNEGIPDPEASIDVAELAKRLPREIAA